MPRVRLYDRLFSVANPLADKEKDYLEFLNPHSLDIVPEPLSNRRWPQAGPEISFSLSVWDISQLIRIVRIRTANFEQDGVITGLMGKMNRNRYNMTVT